MARLNEPPAAPSQAATAAGAQQPESVEALKRRFIRQNRELAKNNSSQSLRIRSLELEVSRLLADNLELRNQVLHLQNEVDTAQRNASNAAVRKVRDELKAKIVELSGIVDGIEDMQENDENVVKEKKPLEGNWRERQPLSELMRDSQMPTIVEDKMYPRRTLGADEIQAIRLSDHSSNESPDLGPPPVAHFDYEDPVKHASPLGRKMSPGRNGTADEDELPAAFSVNLETRRKRKDGQPKLEIRRHSLLPQSPAKGEGETSSILRTGAKRKLSDRETEKPIKPPSKGDFSFRSKTAQDETKTGTEKAAVEPEKATSTKHTDTSAASSPKPVRKVLGDKSVNMSPRKEPSKAEKAEKEKPDKPPSSRPANTKDTGSTRRRRVSSIPLPSPQDEVLQTVEVPPLQQAVQPPPPQTPAPDDLFSPTPSEPSARQEGRGDTPPPSDLSTLSNTTDGGAGRTSRRARSAVSYAEPSLISKMRRPDKKMVDAVTGLQDPRRTMSASGERKTPLPSSQRVAIKKEPLDDESEDVSWKDLPPATNMGASSPLNPKSDLPVSSSREEVISPPPPTDDKPSASSATISALMAGSRRRRQSSQQPLGTDMASSNGPGDLDAATKKMEELDLYEFKESSSPMTDSSQGSGGPTAASKTKFKHRRHSSVPKDGRASDDSAVGAGAAAGEGRLAVARSERAASRRRSMML